MAQDTKDVVFFLMPDGTKVSNDPSFDPDEMREEMLASKPNRGDVGITEAEQKAQTQVEKVASINSTQPGVGENATVDDPIKDTYGPLGSPAMQRQSSGNLPLDADKAKEAGADQFNTSTEDDDPVDSNEKVREVREASQKALEEAAKAQEALGSEGYGDPAKPLSEWSGKQLKAEVARRNAERAQSGEDPLDTTGIRKKSELAQLLEDDGAARGYEHLTGAGDAQES